MLRCFHHPFLLWCRLAYHGRLHIMIFLRRGFGRQTEQHLPVSDRNVLEIAHWDACHDRPSRILVKAVVSA